MLEGKDFYKERKLNCIQYDYKNLTVIFWKKEKLHHHKSYIF